MKKLLKVMAIALLAMLGLNSCSNEATPPSEFIEVDYSKALVGTWTSVEPDYAEAMIIKEDGSFTVSGVMGGNYHEQKGTIKTVNNKVTLTLDNGEKWEGRLEMVVGETFSIILNEKLDFRLTYHYCKEDLSDEIIGMWVCNDFTTDGTDMMIQTFYDDGKCTLTGYLPQEASSEQVKNEATDYKVVGDLLFISIPGETPFHVVDKLVYTPNGTAYGDILTLKTFPKVEDDFVETVWSFLRVKQDLDLADKAYNYSSAYVSNAKGKDEDFSITGRTFNISKIKADDFNMMFHSALFALEFSENSKSIKQTFIINDVDTGYDTPITIDDNKVTLKMSEGNPSFRDVDMFMFQDKDNSQLHIYMPTESFINYFANLELVTLLTESKIDPTDADAVAKVFADMEARIDSINVSFVLKARR